MMPIPIREKTWWKYVLDLFAILGTIFATLAVVIQLQTKLPPALTPSDLSVQMGSFPLYNNENIPMFLGIEKFDKKGAYIGSLPLVLHNAGQSTIQDISVVSRFPKLSRSGLFELINMKTEGALRKQIKAVNDFQEIGHLSLHVTNLERLNPGLSVKIEQPFFFIPTYSDFDVNSFEGFRIPCHVEYALMAEYSVNASDTPQCDYKTTISVQETKDKDSISTDAANFVWNQIIEDNRHRSWIERIISTEKRHTIIGFTKPKLFAKTENGDLYEVRYSPEDLRIIEVTKKPEWPKYVLWFTLPAIAMIICFRFRIPHMIIARFNRNIKSSKTLRRRGTG